MVSTFDNILCVIDCSYNTAMYSRAKAPKLPKPVADFTATVGLSSQQPATVPVSAFPALMRPLDSPRLCVRLFQSLSTLAKRVAVACILYFRKSS